MMTNPGRNYSYYKEKLESKNAEFFAQLKYKGNKVTCSSYSMDDDGELDLTCCKVEGGTGTGYNYKNNKLEKNTDETCNAKENNNGNDEDSQNNNTTFEMEEEVTVNEEKYNVIGQGEDYVTLLKQQPLTENEINTYGGVGTDHNHVNKNTRTSIGTSYNRGDSNQTGGLSYYSSPTCRLGNSNGCENEGAPNYYYSDIRYVVDNWAMNKFGKGYLKEVDGYKARLVQKEELQSQFYPNCNSTATTCYKENETPSWLYNSVYWYWTMTEVEDSNIFVWVVSEDGRMNHSYYIFECYDGAIRPVINVSKSKITKGN